MYFLNEYACILKKSYNKMHNYVGFRCFLVVKLIKLN